MLSTLSGIYIFLSDKPVFILIWIFLTRISLENIFEGDKLPPDTRYGASTRSNGNKEVHFPSISRQHIKSFFFSGDLAPVSFTFFKLGLGRYQPREYEKNKPCTKSGRRDVPEERGVRGTFFSGTCESTCLNRCRDESFFLFPAARDSWTTAAGTIR